MLGNDVIDLRETKLLLVTGKGGVGKSVVTAAFALRAAQAGRRVLVCEMDEQPAMAALFGSRAEVAFEPKRIHERIDACNVRGMAAMQAFLYRFVPSRRATDLLLKNRVARVFFESAPGVMESVMLDRVATHIESGAYDLVVVDMPATGHAYTLLRLPASMAAMVSVGQLAAHMKALATVLGDRRRSSLVLVTLPEELPVQETLEFEAKVRAGVDTPVSTIVINGLRTMTVPDDEPAWVADLAPGPRERWREALALARHWSHEDQRGLAKLEAEAKAGLVTIPWIFRRDDDFSLVGAVTEALARWTVY